VPLASEIVCAVDELTIAGAVSKYAVTVGFVSVLLVKVSEPAKVARVPVVGSVTPVVPETVNVVAKAPEIVSVLAALLDTPVPPLAGANVPATVTAPDVAVEGVKPVVPNVIVVTGAVTALLARSLTTPELFLKYSFSSKVLSASSPATKFAASGAAAAVVL
jgi:hypothetical protein